MDLAHRAGFNLLVLVNAIVSGVDAKVLGRRVSKE
jgi:hypothetical protein